MADEALRDAVLARLQPLPVTSRAMFGGHGLWLDGRFFGTVFDGRLYFRTDDASRPDYLARGSAALQPPPHRPRGKRTVDRNFEVPPEILADDALLRAWAERAAKAY